jgi:2-polyprenyl-6-methoxyphenol hydroxylase-like FAD-dependent oxidoreductase
MKALIALEGAGSIVRSSLYQIDLKSNFWPEFVLRCPAPPCETELLILFQKSAPARPVSSLRTANQRLVSFSEDGFNASPIETTT